MLPSSLDLRLAPKVESSRLVPALRSKKK
jgi:hypothetical protein